MRERVRESERESVRERESERVRESVREEENVYVHTTRQTRWRDTKR